MINSLKRRQDENIHDFSSDVLQPLSFAIDLMEMMPTEGLKTDHLEQLATVHSLLAIAFKEGKNIKQSMEAATRDLANLEELQVKSTLV
jgi:hypothetical protein